jgi:hypothetical protein
MTVIIALLAPIFLAIGIGWAARFTRMVPEQAWGGVNRLAYTILAPTLIFTEVAKAQLSLAEGAFIVATVTAFVLTGATALLLRPIAGSAAASFASAHQGVQRWNTFLALAAASALWGGEGTALIALVMGPAIPVVNIITVYVHARNGAGQNPSFAGVLRSLATNPMIIACVLGLAANAAEIRFPDAAAEVLDIIGRAALGITLMCVGAGLDIRAIASKPALMAVSVGAKLAAAPAIFISVGLLAGLDGLHLAAMALIGASPSPPAAYILSKEMGGDPRFMAGHITATTLLCALTIPAARAAAAALS